MQGFIDQNKSQYPTEEQTLEWMSLTGDFAADIRKGQSIISEWYPKIAAMSREPLPLSGLFLAQQCGGSDAFSGISANPLLGKLSKHLVMHGGTAVLAETDELIGGESAPAAGHCQCLRRTPLCFPTETPTNVGADEMVGNGAGETYVVENSRNLETAQAFIDMVERFKAYAGRFGYSAEVAPLPAGEEEKRRGGG